MTVQNLRHNISEKEMRQWMKFINWELNPESTKDVIAQLMTAGFKKGTPDGV